MHSNEHELLLGVSHALLMAIAKSEAFSLPFDADRLPAKAAKWVREVSGEEIGSTEVDEWIHLYLDLTSDIHEERCGELARGSGYEVWETGGGCTAWGLVVPGHPDDVVHVTDEGGTGAIADPDAPIWGAGRYRNGRTVAGCESGLGGLTLEQALARGKEYAAKPFKRYKKGH